MTPEVPWKSRAICADKPPEIFFPTKREHLRRAKAVCADCPVRAECLQSAFDNHDIHGVWGGLGPDEIRTYRNKGMTNASQVLAVELGKLREAERKKRRLGRAA